MTKRFIDYIVADYELPTPLFKRSNKTISPHVSTKQMSAQLQVQLSLSVVTLALQMFHQRSQVHNNLPEEEHQTTRVDITRYRKTVSSALWLQLVLLLCYLPFLLLIPFTYRKTEINLSTAVDTTVTLMYFNSYLNPILYCWRIKLKR